MTFSGKQTGRSSNTSRWQSLKAYSIIIIIIIALGTQIERAEKFFKAN